MLFTIHGGREKEPEESEKKNHGNIWGKRVQSREKSKGLRPEVKTYLMNLSTFVYV